MASIWLSLRKRGIHVSLMTAIVRYCDYASPIPLSIVSSHVSRGQHGRVLIDADQGVALWP